MEIKHTRGTHPYFQFKIDRLNQWKASIDEAICRLEGLETLPKCASKEEIFQLQEPEHCVMDKILHNYMKDHPSGDVIASFVLESMDSALLDEELEREDEEYEH